MVAVIAFLLNYSSERRLGSVEASFQKLEKEVKLSEKNLESLRSKVNWLIEYLEENLTESELRKIRKEFRNRFKDEFSSQR